MGNLDFWAVVPVKDFKDAKSRLVSVLDANERRQLSQTMLRDVLRAVSAVPRLAGTIVVTHDAEAAGIAGDFGARVLFEDNNRGPTEAVMLAVHWLAAKGHAGMISIPSDIPLVNPEEINHLLEAHGTAPALTITPARDGGGSNAIVCTPPDAIPLRYGENSFSGHLETAEQYGVPIKTAELPGIGLDIDKPEDLLVLVEKSSTSLTARYLIESGIARRLRKIDPDRLTRAEARELAELTDDALPSLIKRAAALRDKAHGDIVSYSRKVFIPLTQLCRDVCHYCTFAKAPKKLKRAYMTAGEVLAIARAGQAAGCREALFTLGDKPELRFQQARVELQELGFETTLEYVASMARLVFEETGLLPHINAGLMSGIEAAGLKEVSISQGMMLESASPRLCEKGGPHFGSPDKDPAARLQAISEAGHHKVPMTSGILVGIGETREEYIDSLLALRDLHDKYGHIHEIIIQNFRAKPGTMMSDAPEPAPDHFLWAVASARLVFGPAMNIQAPPNLSPGLIGRLIGAGINDWGGISPVTPDHVNPEAPWPHLDAIAAETKLAGKILVERLAVYPETIFGDEDLIAPALRTPVLHAIDASGFVRTDNWWPGEESAVPTYKEERRAIHIEDALSRIMSKAVEGLDLAETEITALFEARGTDFTRVCEAADRLRKEIKGGTVSYVVNRNINYTNVCYFRCGFCAFSKGKMSENLRGRPYDLGLEEIVRRTGEAKERGATEVCLQGGIHPAYTGETYLSIVRAIHQAHPDMHIHAFSPLEVWHGAETLGLSLNDYLGELSKAGLGTLPGTAAEILDDEVRNILCHDKINTRQWCEVIEASHQIGVKTTSTIMFGHVERTHHWSRHLLILRELQKRSGGITEFVPLPFVHLEAPIYLKGRARKGPTFREAVLMHAVARLALHPHIPNIQTSWVKMGPGGVAAALKAGVNDLGGTLMNESISRAAGSTFGQELPPEQMEATITAHGRMPHQRTTVYGQASNSSVAASFNAPPLTPIINGEPEREKGPSDNSELIRAGE